MNLSRVLREYRWAAKTDGRSLSAEIGISHSTLTRIEKGEVPSGRVLALLLMWLLREEGDGHSDSGTSEQSELQEEEL